MTDVLLMIPEHYSARQKPKNLSKEDEILFAHQFLKKIPQTTLEKVINANILGDCIFNFSSFKFFAKYTHVEGLSAWQKFLRLRFLLLPKFKINKGVWIIDNWSYEYFHWLTDALPRLIVAEEYIENHEILLPSKFRKSPYVDSLKAFNFNISFFNSKYPVSVKELIIPSHTAPTGNYNKDVINKLRKRFNQNSVKVIPSKKIFVSRGKARFRKISNEAEVIRLVMSFGYEVHYFEDYSFRDQVSLMQQATHLIGLHGAGLTNMLFMPENGKVLELRNANDDHNNCFYALASDLGHEYYYLLNQGDAADTHFVNITVRTEELASVLQQIDND